MHFRARPRFGTSLARQPSGDIFEANHLGHQRVGHNPAVAVGRDRLAEPGRASEDSDDSHVTQGDPTAVEQARLGRDADQDQPPSGFDMPEAQSWDSSVDGCVDNTIEKP